MALWPTLICLVIMLILIRNFFGVISVVLNGAFVFLERYSKPHVIEKKKRLRAASNASW